MRWTELPKSLSVRYQIMEPSAMYLRQTRRELGGITVVSLLISLYMEVSRLTGPDDKGQYPDGLRAPMIIHDREWEASLEYDLEFAFSVSDWYVIPHFHSLLAINLFQVSRTDAISPPRLPGWRWIRWPHFQRTNAHARLKSPQ
jgi:hypothetical protein